MRTLTILSLLIASGTLSACGTSNKGLESVHQPVVSRTDYVFDLPAPVGTRITDGDARRLADWFDSLQLRYGDHISVDNQGTPGNARDAVAAVAARYGLLVDDQAPITQGAIPAGAVRVVVSRMIASVPGCPDWSRPATPNLTGDRMSNYGCAINTNLAAMVADPRDLIAGRTGPSSVDAEVSGKAITSYRKAAPTGAAGLKTETTKGN